MPIYDAYGNLVRLKKRPGKGFGAVVQVKDREYDFSTRTLTPSGLWSAAMSADNGDTSAMQTYFEKAPRHDPRLYDLINRRTGAVSGLEWAWKPYTDSKDEEPKEPDKKIADFVADVWDRIPKIQDHVKGILNAIGNGFAVWDINWQTDKWTGVGEVIRPFLRTMPNRYYTFQKLDSEEVVTTDWPNFLTDTEPAFGEPLQPENTVFAVYQDAPEVWHCGIMQGCIWHWLRKRQIFSQYMSTGERFAEPIPIGYYGLDDENDQIRELMLDLIDAYGPNASIALAGTGGPLAPDADGRVRGGYLSHEQPNLNIPKDFWLSMLEAIDREMAIAWTSGNLLTDTSGGTGTHAAAKVQRTAEKEDIREHDADWLQMGPVQDLVYKIVLFNKGEEAAKRLPYLEFPGLKESEDLELKSRVYKTIGETNWDGVRDMPEEVKEIFEVPDMEEPEEEEEPAAMPPPGGPPGEQSPPPVPQEPPIEPDIAEKLGILAECACPVTLKTPPGARKLAEEVASLLKLVDPLNDQAVGMIQDRVAKHLLRLKNAPKTAKAFQKYILGVIDGAYDEMSAELADAGLDGWFEETYRYYKTSDRTLWPRGAPDSALSFGAKDVRMSHHMGEQAYWHFSRFTDNETFREPMQKFLVKTYATDGQMLNARNPEVVKAFRKTLGETTKSLSDAAVDRIARTSVARAREQARIMQMADAGVSEATVLTHPDACEICSPYSGKVISVQEEVQWVEHLDTLEGDAYHEALRDRSKQAIKGIPPHDFTGDVDGPLYHPNCRCGVQIK
jgi:phage gp29-like protein/histone H3/H4